MFNCGTVRTVRTSPTDGVACAIVLPCRCGTRCGKEDQCDPYIVWHTTVITNNKKVSTAAYVFVLVIIIIIIIIIIYVLCCVVLCCVRFLSSFHPLYYHTIIGLDGALYAWIGMSERGEDRWRPRRRCGPFIKLLNNNRKRMAQ